MKLALVRNLKGSGDEVLAKDVMNNQGGILLKKGTIITKHRINQLKRHSIFFVHIQSDDLEDLIAQMEYLSDPQLNNVKQDTLKHIPSIFNDLTTCNIQNLENSMRTVHNLIDYIIHEGSANTNLYEIKSYDNYTYIHCVDTCIMATFLGTKLNYNEQELKLLGLASLFHDVGKTKLSNSLINKKGKLTKYEFNQIKLHPFYGKEILSKIKDMPSIVIEAVSQHHEKVDGTGYPFGLKGNEICEFAKIISVCDVFTAVSANRAYRPRFNPGEAYELILTYIDTYFDPKIISVFKDCFAIYPLGCCVKLSNSLEGFVVKQNKSFPDRPVIRILYDKNKNKIAPYEIDLLYKTNIAIVSVI